MDLTEKLDYSSAVALLGFSLILAILRCFNVRVEAARVMVSAPLLAFVTTHILYLNFYKFDYGIITFFHTLLCDPQAMQYNLYFFYLLLKSTRVSRSSAICKFIVIFQMLGRFYLLPDHQLEPENLYVSLPLPMFLTLEGNLTLGL